MERVTGIGGIFFKAQDPKTLKAWYRDHLGVPLDGDGYVTFHWREQAGPEQDVPERVGMTVWEAFPQDTSYFGDDSKPFMINYRVNDLDALLGQLRAAGVAVDDHIEEGEYGRFAWATDPEGNRFELWQPPDA